jgi:hypothetical protein
MGVGLGQRGLGKLAATVRDGPKQRPFGVGAQTAAVEIGGQILLKSMVARHDGHRCIKPFWVKLRKIAH